ncbi:hypothetical protein DOR63_21305 [Salmonella enterica subsp. enterica]|nr:hypothetical protein [Salmonella enterica subsp. enterica serovar Bareilly]
MKAENIIPAQAGWWVVMYAEEACVDLIQAVYPVIAWKQIDDGLIPLTWDIDSNAATTQIYQCREFGTVMYYPRDDFQVKVRGELDSTYQIPGLDLEET